MQNALGAMQMPSKVNLHTCKEDKFGADLRASIIYLSKAYKPSKFAFLF